LVVAAGGSAGLGSAATARDCDGFGSATDPAGSDGAGSPPGDEFTCKPSASGHPPACAYITSCPCSEISPDTATASAGTASAPSPAHATVPTRSATASITATHSNTPSERSTLPVLVSTMTSLACPRPHRGLDTARWRGVIELGPEESNERAKPRAKGCHDTQVPMATRLACDSRIVVPVAALPLLCPGEHGADGLRWPEVHGARAVPAVGPDGGSGSVRSRPGVSPACS